MSEVFCEIFKDFGVFTSHTPTANLPPLNWLRINLATATGNRRPTQSHTSPTIAQN